MRQREERDQPWLGLVLHIDDAGVAERFVAALRDRLGIHHHQRPSVERHRAVHRDEGLERRRKRQLAHHRRLALVGDVEDDKAARAVGQVGAIALHIGTAVQHGAELHTLFAARDPLALAPPARHFHRVGRVGNVHDLVDMPVVALGQRGGVHIAPAVIEVAVRARAAGAVVAEALRVFRVLEAPDIEALTKRRTRFTAPAVGNLFHRRDHQTVGNLDLQGPGVRRPLDEAHEARVRGIGHLDYRPAAHPEMRAVEIPAIARLVQGHLERGPVLQVDMRDRLDIACPGFSRG